MLKNNNEKIETIRYNLNKMKLLNELEDAVVRAYAKIAMLNEVLK